MDRFSFLKEKNKEMSRYCTKKETYAQWALGGRVALVDKFRPLAWEVGVQNQPLAVGINCFEIIVDVSDIILLYYYY